MLQKIGADSTEFSRYSPLPPVLPFIDTLKYCDTFAKINKAILARYHL